MSSHVNVLKIAVEGVKELIWHLEHYTNDDTAIAEHKAALALLETLAAYTVEVMDEASDLSYARVSNQTGVCKLRSIEKIGDKWEPAPWHLSYADALVIIAALQECERRNREAAQ